jgi:hypothetical protein
VQIGLLTNEGMLKILCFDVEQHLARICSDCLNGDSQSAKGGKIMPRNTARMVCDVSSSADSGDPACGHGGELSHCGDRPGAAGWDTSAELALVCGPKNVV